MKCIAAFVILISVHAWASIAFVNSGDTKNGGGSCAVTLSVTSGNVAIVAITTNSGASTQTVSDTNGDTFSLALPQFTIGSVVTSIWTAPLGTTNATETFTMTNSNTANNEQCVAMQYSGVSTSTPVDKTATGTYSAVTSLTSGTTATTSQANEMLIGFFACTGMNGGNFTQGSGYTLRVNDGYLVSLATEDEVVSATGAYQATMTASAAATGAGIIVTLQPPAAAGVKRMRGAVISR